MAETFNRETGNFQPDVVDLSSWAHQSLTGQLEEWTPTQTPRTVTASDSVNPLDDLVLVSGNSTLTLETAVGADGRRHTFVKTDSSATTMTIAGTPTINGAASLTATAQYAAFQVISDGTEWKAIKLDLAAAVGILLAVNGGTGFGSYAVGDMLYANTTTTLAKLVDVATGNVIISGGVGVAPSYGKIGLTTHVTGILPSANGGQSTMPLMQYGGLNFNGTTTYLDGNALTGIADGKVGTFYCKLRFANAATVIEKIIDSTGVAFSVTRTAAGNIRVVAENAAGTVIMLFASSGASCAAAGTYSIEASWNLASAGSGRLYIEDVSNYVETTFTDDTIDYTVTEYSVGASVAGADFFSGDMYILRLSSTQYQDFSNEATRRRYADVNNVPMFLGSNGELPGASSPILFLAYINGSTAGRARWTRNRGDGVGTFVENGAIAAPSTTLNGQYAPISGFYTPTVTNVANVATTAYECQYMRDSSRFGGTQMTSGRVNVDPTLTATSTQVGISLAFASAITAAEQCAGTAVAPGIAGQCAAILGDATNDRAQMQWVSTDITAQDMYFQFMAKTI